MMADNYRVNIKLAFEDTDQERSMTFDMGATPKAGQADIKERILAINASLAAGTSDGLNEFILSDDGDNFASISSAQIVYERETAITIPR